MDIRVSGHQVDVGGALRGHAVAELNAANDKYQTRATSAQVTFGKGPHDHGFTCEILVYAPQGQVLKSTERGAAALAAFDSALDKLVKQMRRSNRRQKDHHGAPDYAEALLDAAPAVERRGGV